MNKLIFLLCLAVYLTSCDQKSHKLASQSETKTRKIDPFLTEIFEKEFKNYKNNTLIKDKALSELISKIDSLAPLNYLEDIPLKILRVQKNPHGKGAIVQFYTDNFDREKSNMLSNQLKFDIIGFMSEELASTLDEKKTYMINGRKYKRLNDTETYIIVNQTYFRPEPEISEDIIYSGIYNFEVGVFFSEIDSVRLVK